MKIRTFLLLIQCLLFTQPTSAQDLEPRRWTALPTGTNVLGIAYAHTFGDLFFDPVLLVEDAEVTVDTSILSYVRSFGLAGKTARFDAIIPWHKARWEGLLNSVPTTVNRTGLGDPRFRLSVNLAGAPALGPRAFRQHRLSNPVNTVVGAALELVVPWGKYHKDKLLNIGRNRFTIRPQIGVVHTRGPWSYELTGSVFLFTDNDSFFNGQRREQDPLYAIQTHVIKTIKPGLWTSLSAGYGFGGESTIDGVDKNDKTENFLSALSVGFRIAPTQTVKAAYIISRTQNSRGADTDTLLLGWSVLF